MSSLFLLLFFEDAYSRDAPIICSFLARNFCYRWQATPAVTEINCHSFHARLLLTYYIITRGFRKNGFSVEERFRTRPFPGWPETSVIM